MVLSLTPFKNLSLLVNNQKKKKKDNETSEPVDGSLRTEKTSKFITETKQINKDSLFIFFPSSKSVKIARLAIQRNPIN